MAKNREASQFNSLVNVNDTTGQVGIANSVGSTLRHLKEVMHYMFKEQLMSLVQ